MAEMSLLEWLVPLGAAIAVTALIGGLLYPRIVGDAAADRMKNVTDAKGRRAARTAADITSSRKKAVADTLRDLDARKKKTERASLRSRLQQSGLDMDVKSYWMASALLGVVCAGVVMVMLPDSLAAFAPILALIAALVAGLGLSNWVLNWMIKRRQNKFTANLANAIDVVVRGVKTGLPLNECLNIIAKESPEPIASEFKEVVDQQRLGVTLGEALDRLVVRMPLPEVKFLAIVISIQQSAGGNLSEALGNLSQVLRDRFGLKLKVKALSAEALASAMVLGSLPPIVILLIHLSSPTYLTPLFSTKTGNMCLLVSAVLMSIGIWVMRKMINFKY